MGLDIYLYNGKDNLHFGDEQGKSRDKWWEGDRSKAKSQKYPEHYCERTYLRSSYNGSGFNRVVENLTGKDFYYIFGEKITKGLAEPPWDPEDGEDPCREKLSTEQVKAELREALVRAKEVTAAVKEIKQPLRVITIAAKNYFAKQPETAQQKAIEATKAELARYDKRKEAAFGGSYSNSFGDFFLDEPLKVIAAIPGVDALGSSAVHLVFEDTGFEWYVQAAEICEEFIEFALTLNDPRVSWSG